MQQAGRERALEARGVRHARAGGVAAVRLRPTRLGWAYLGMCVLTLVGCINYQLSLGYFFCFVLLALWPLCALYARRGAQGLHLRARADNEPAVGQTVRFVLAVDNPSALPRLLALRVPQAGALLELPERSSGEAALAWTAGGRGLLRLPPLTLESSDPLGLFAARTVQQLEAQTVVYPALEPDPPTLPAEVGRAGPGGGRRAAGGEDFAGIRPYQPGDSPRRIAWRYQRGDALLTKQFDSPVSQALLLGWAQAGSALEPEARLSRLAAWATLAERAGRRYGLELPGNALEPGQGEAHLRRVLTALATFEVGALERRVPRPAPVGTGSA